MTTENHALEQAKAQASNIAEMVAALNINYDRLEELRDRQTDGWLDDSQAEELAELEDAAGDCESYDAAVERIQEDPLSVQVRSGWHAVGETAEPEEFEILLCTGGPAVRIMGELNEHREPGRAWIEYQDWGTPWMQLFNGIDQQTLLTYCQQFYFGE